MPTKSETAPPCGAATAASVVAAKRATPRIPKYRLHRATGQAVVTLGGKDAYLGSHNSPESIERYHRAVAEHLAGVQRRSAASGIVVAELALRYLDFANDYYRKGGRRTSQVAIVRSMLKVVTPLYGRLPAAEFATREAAACRDAMVRNGWCRTHVNRQVGVLAGMFRWASAAPDIMLSVEVAHRIRALTPLKRGRCDVREGEAVRPVDDAIVDATLPHLSRQARALVELQRLTGARSGELVLMRGMDLDTSGPTWLYRPSTHKTEHRGRERRIFIGPKGVEIVRPFLRSNLAEFLFQPAEAEAERRASEHAARRIKRSYGNRPGTNRKANPQWSPGTCYTSTTLRVAIARACDAAFPPPSDLADASIARWRKEHRWHPHQLRHSAATRIRREHGLEAAKACLGHSAIGSTQHYAEIDTALARRVMQVAG